MMEDAQPATAIFVEFYSVGDSDFVRVYYKRDAFDLDVYTLYDRMPLNEFQSLV